MQSEDESAYPIGQSIDVKFIDQDSEANEMMSQYQDSEFDLIELPRSKVDSDLRIEEFNEENSYSEQN